VIGNPKKQPVFASIVQIHPIMKGSQIPSTGSGQAMLRTGLTWLDSMGSVNHGYPPPRVQVSLISAEFF